MFVNERGFTLADLLVSVAIIGIVMAGILALQVQGQLAYLMGAARVESQQNVRAALEILTQELRSARSIAGCSATSVQFNDTSNAPVAYTLDTTRTPYALQRAYNNGLASDVVGVVSVTNGVVSLTTQPTIFTCYEGDGYTETADPAQVKSVMISLATLATDAAGGSTTLSQNQSTTIESRVRLRNLP